VKRPVRLAKALPHHEFPIVHVEEDALPRMFGFEHLPVDPVEFRSAAGNRLQRVISGTPGGGCPPCRRPPRCGARHASCAAAVSPGRMRASSCVCVRQAVVSPLEVRAPVYASADCMTTIGNEPLTYPGTGRRSVKVNWLEVAQSAGTVLAAVVTAVATVFLWRVTRVLADETRRLAQATSQPQVVAQLLPSPWSLIHADFIVQNTGTGTAFDIEINFDPPLEQKRSGDLGGEVPFHRISILKAGQSLRSYIGQFHPHLDKIYRVSISWRRTPEGRERESISYTLDMTMFKSVSQLGASDPLVQLAEELKKMREDWRNVASGFRAIEVDVHTRLDRAKDERELQRRWRREEKQQAAAPQPVTDSPPDDEGSA
jgi:hypothetical protein